MGLVDSLCGVVRITGGQIIIEVWFRRMMVIMVDESFFKFRTIDGDNGNNSV